MLVQAAGLALLAALSPTALLITAVYLGSARPRMTAAFYLFGALVMSLVTGIVILVILRNAGLSLPTERTPRYGVRLALGIILVVSAFVLNRRRQRDRTKDKPGFVARMAARPAPLTAFAVGLILFAPGVTFLAALQVIATAHAKLGLTALSVLVVVVLNVLLVWVPYVFYLLAPEVTSRHLTGFNAWLRANGSTIVVWVLVVVGAIMVGNGIYGLTVVR
jgi:hypothetical protein